MKRVKFYPISAPVPTVNTGRSAAVAYVSCVTSLVLVGGVLLSNFGDKTSMIAGLPIPPTSECLRVRRRADYTTVLVPIGTPAREAELLFRPDRVVDNNAVFIVGTANSQSVSLNCNGTSCTDSVRVQTNGPSSDAKIGTVNFVYVSRSIDDSVGGSLLGLEGELALRRGYSYWLTASHLCWDITNMSHSPHASFPAKTSTGFMVTETVFAGPTDCNSSHVYLFPAAAAHEKSFLGLSSSYLYEHADSIVEIRRLDAERGILCAGDDTAYARDCMASLSCRQHPSVPYRRLTSTSLMVIQTHGEDAIVALQNTNTLSRVAGLLSVDSAVLIGVLRLLLMVLAAVVAYVRSSQESSNSVAMLVRAQRSHQPPTLPFTWENVFLDAVIGIIAVVARFVVVMAMRNTLIEDGLRVVVVSETVGTITSVVHFVLRHTIHIDINDEIPLTKLGGSMALVDTALSIIVVFADSPVLGNQIAFASIGRMLAVILICISCIPLSIFAAVSCAVTFARNARSEGFWYQLWWFWSGVAWIVQLCTVGLSLGHCFAGPLAYQLVRLGSTKSSNVRLLIFVCTILASLPSQHRVLLETTAALSKNK